MIKIEGLEKLAKEMDQLQRAIEALDGELGSVRFDPDDPQSIEVAIQRMEAEIDQRVVQYSRNDMVEGIVAEMKETFRREILDRAAQARSAEEPEA